jgi:hypothetical protein
MRETSSTDANATERSSLRRRVKNFYKYFGQTNWPQCYQFIDPNLIEHSKVDFSSYCESLSLFHAYYGPIDILHIRINLYLQVKTAKNEKADFAYVFVEWKDKKNHFHVFRERWVKVNRRWYTRVVGLVTHEKGEENQVATER